MELLAAKDCIECNGATIIAKKINTSTPLFHNVIGRCIKYLCSRDGQAIIEKELTKDSEKFKQLKCGLKIGDYLKANEFSVLVLGYRPAKVEKIDGKFSHTHNARGFETNSYTYAQIAMPYPAGKTIQKQLPDPYTDPLDNLSKKMIE